MLYLYYVDWSDRAFPRIGITTDKDIGKTFGQAKAELIEYCQHQRQHWADAVNAARAITSKEVRDGEAVQ